ncbi:MAG: class I SAM-dependent methyltransferase [Planctomycetota bacterium]
MIETTTVAKQSIRSHYDLATPFYRLLWGPHIHHGLWSAEDAARLVPKATPRAAQEHLTDTLAGLSQVGSGQRVLDVGCGMGGSSIRLARKYGCHVTGITLSGVQRRWAAVAATLQGVGNAVEFRRIDAEVADFAASSFDVVWSIECTEHLFDKAAFFQRVGRWVKPGGRVAICAWLAARDADLPAKRPQVKAVLEAFLCPSLGSFDDYRGWMTAAGLVVEVEEDWTARVCRTWEICDRRVKRLGLPWLARFVDPAQGLFLERFGTLLGAYTSGAMQYGCFVARRPPA